MSPQNNTLGIWLMIATSFVFAMQDGVSRHLAGEYNVLMIIMIRYWFFASFVIVVAARQAGGLRAAVATRQPILQIFRGVLLALEVEIILGDARTTLPHWDGQADAWYLDGFSPARNPELWTDTLMAEVGRHTKAGGSFATYTAAGHVRRALAAAGFTVTRAPGYRRKRHMSRGHKA